MNTIATELDSVTLNDKYDADDGQVFLNGSQALARMMLVQARRDAAAGLNTAGFVSGYRGSPLHIFDLEMGRINDVLEQHKIKFEPLINEDLAATAVRGSQMAGVYGDAKYDGVFSYWYGKNPGLDRSVDAIRHANFCGSGKNGGALALIGDDHGMRSTDTMAHCEATCEDLMMPLIYPANLQEVLDLGILGMALSRFCGAWVGFKLLPEAVECSGTVDADINRVNVVEPEFDMPEGGLHTRAMDIWLVTRWDQRLVRHKLPAAVAFARANKLNYVSHTSATPRFGIVAAGKGWLDVQEAFRSMGFSEADLDSLGITIYKVGMVWPHDEQGYREFARGLDEVLVVEEKREQMETAIRNACYDLPEAERPRVVGRNDESGELLVDQLLDMTPEMVANAIASRISYFAPTEGIASRQQLLAEQAEKMSGLEALAIARPPFFCSGCPHNTSTNTPEGSRSYAGIGCHGMAMLTGRSVDEMHMGAEGTNWIGESPFVSTEHVFQNLGDGTYTHSGSLAVRAANATGANVTYKILFNDAVAMTGGQDNEIGLTPQMISQQMYAEGVRKICVVTDEPRKYGIGSGAGFAPGVTVHHRRELESIQHELQACKGVSILIYDQTCAAEKRRRRKRGTFPDPDQRMFINDRVCEGCGDCGKKSNCLSVLPKDTDFGRKRSIDQSSCNKDFSCLEGFCPSFVTVHGGKLRKLAGVGADSNAANSLPEPTIVDLPDDDNYRILIAGVGGTGVVTIGALIGMAARLEGKAATVLDQMGLAQKGGSVLSHIRIARNASDIKAIRVNTGASDLLLACDMLVGGSPPAMSTVLSGRTRAIINTEETITGAFISNADMDFPAATLRSRLTNLLGEERTNYLDATSLATRLMGDAIASNLFLLGFAWQQGTIPVSEAALIRAIELNGVKVDWNKDAFMWGRRAAHDVESVKQAANVQPEHSITEQSLQEQIDFYAKELVSFQDEEYAARYLAIVGEVQQAEQKLARNSTELSEVVARYAYKLMAYKDEYEVARLYSSPEFKSKLDAQFEGSYSLEFNLAPPGMAKVDPATGEPSKVTFGPWMMKAFGQLQRLKFLRGTAFDPFGRSVERKRERGLIEEYRNILQTVMATLDEERFELALELASLPEGIRGYGHVKERHLAEFDKKKEELLARWQGTPANDGPLYVELSSVS